jgi:hypothetical protein
VDRFSELPLGSQQSNGYLLETLAAQSRVEVLKAELVSETQGRFKFGKQPLVTRRLCLGVLGQRSQLVGAFASCPNALSHVPAFSDESLQSGVRFVESRRGLDGSNIHEAKVRVSADKLASARRMTRLKGDVRARNYRTYR